MEEKFSSEEKLKKELKTQKALTSFYQGITKSYQKIIDDLVETVKSEKTWIVPFKFAQYLEEDGSIKILNSPREAHKFSLAEIEAIDPRYLAFKEKVK